MKYIREYHQYPTTENPWNIDSVDSKVGDYVIVETIILDDKIRDFVHNRIGQLVKITKWDEYSHFVKYEMNNFDIFKDKKDIIIFEIERENNKDYVTIPMQWDELKYWSEDKEELEILLASKKYNL